MPIYDYLCPNDHEFEAIARIEERALHCPECGREAVRILRAGGTNLSNEAAPWLRSVLEVVEKDSTKPHVVEFLKNPTRSNYKAWMRGEGIRHLEPGEKPRKEELDPRRHAEKIMRLRQQRERIEL